jgi:hypothetical protein
VRVRAKENHRIVTECWSGSGDRDNSLRHQALGNDAGVKGGSETMPATVRTEWMVELA